MAKNKLSDIVLDEVSLVDRPANQKASVVLFKRASEEEELGKVIRQEGGKWKLFSEDGTKLLGEFATQEEATAREKQIKYFKHTRKSGDGADDISDGTNTDVVGALGERLTALRITVLRSRCAKAYLR
jgi:hypothetical protein